MKPFRFKLQTALDLKLRQEDALKGELQRQQEAVREKEAELARLRNTMADAVDNIRPHAGMPFDVEERRLFNHYWLRLKELEARQETELQREQSKLEEIRQRLLEMMRDRKVMERLKEKHLADYKKTLLREEQKLLDEMALNRFIGNHQYTE
ncbi:flagellar export protein FliJ [Heliobacterium gestii]|uniref:Flagellar FliJ protein n=1 Tax=Heliomicrobium gestii TaxID=2699 RepID=A0A845L9R2_HELGE|nr:flagellar export protein FliJ [Heliomicrobium gestii]MBM7867109.1 flagellar FliJ protein [Heliomicrobium gestii]MZP43477.1 flagellar export protein FliJ [Heliomicrobium gestii]